MKARKMQGEMAKFLAILAALISFCSYDAQAVEYYITDIGTLDSDPQSRAYAINDYGQVVGYSGMIQGPEEGRRAFLWDSADGMQNLGTLGGNHSEAYGINNSGQVIGRSTLPGSESEVRGFLWENDSMSDLGTLAGGWTEARGINDSGQVVGYSVLSDSVTAFLWENGSMSDLGSLSDHSRGYAINNAGQIVGYCFGSASFHTTASLWSEGYIISLGLGSDFSYAWDISNSGWVVGEFDVSGSLSHAFLWIDGVITDIGEGTAEAINDTGQIVGNFGLWENGTTTPLVDMLSDNGGWADLYGRDINNSGQIVGEGYINGELHAFLMTPVPEPSSVMLLSLGLSVLLRKNRNN